MTTPREMVIEALKQGPATLSELAGMLPVLARDTVRDAARHASEAGLVSKRIDESNQPLYALTPEGKAWVPHKGKKRDKPATLPAPAYDPRQVSFNQGDRADSLAVRNHNIIDAICEAIGFDDDQPMEALVEHVKVLKERAEKAWDRLESLAIRANKFCAWVAEEFPASRPYPANLHECQETLKAWKEGQENRLTDLQAIAARYRESDDACGAIHAICHDAGMPEGNVVDRVEGLVARMAMLEANASLPVESAPDAPVATVKESLTAQYAIAVDEDLHSTPEAAIAAIAHVHDLHDNEVVRNLTIVAVNPVGKIALVPTMVPICEAA